MPVSILAPMNIGVHGDDGLGVARCTLRRGGLEAPRPARFHRFVRFHTQRGSGGLCETGYGAVDERAGRGAKPHDGRALLARSYEVVRSLTGSLPCSSDRAKRVSEEVGRCFRGAFQALRFTLQDARFVVAEAIVVLVTLRRMTRALDRKTAAAQFENGASEGVAHAAHQFFRGVSSAVSENFEELVRFGQPFTVGGASKRHRGGRG